MTYRYTKAFSTLLFFSTCLWTNPIGMQASSIQQTAIDFTGVAKASIPAVVSIKVQGNTLLNQGMAEDDLNDEFWNRFFGFPRGRQEQHLVTGQGSGFLISPDGYIVTNNHIVDNTDKIVVTLNDGKEYPAKVIGKDSSTDLAVLKIDGTNFPYLKFANPKNLEVGQWAVAIGNPFGLQATLTVGVISALGRHNLGIIPSEDFIQTDAAINRGNSGGPLLNLAGEVIGINTAIASNTGGSMGVGFAIPSSIAQQVADQLVATGTVTRGFIGVYLQNVDADLAAAFGLKNAEGALIGEVTKDSPAEKAGLRQGDIILKYNNQKVENVSTLRTAISLMKPGVPVTLEILRDHQTNQVQLAIGSHPDNNTKPHPSNEHANKLGLQVEALSKEKAHSLGYKEEEGLLVTKVEPGSFAALAGIKKDVLILAINQKEVTTPEEFYQIVKETGQNRPLLLLVKQGNVTRFIALKIG